MSFLPKYLISPLLFLIALATSANGQSLLESEPLQKSTSELGNGPLFHLLDPAVSGVDLTIPIEADHELARAYYSSSACSGVAIGDLDLDGKPDIFAGSGPGANALYLQREFPKFENVATPAGVAGDAGAWAVGISLVDVDNDGDLDVYVCNYDSPNNLYINLTIDGGERQDGPLRFEDRAEQYGVNLTDGSVMPAFADYDRDGDLDLYLLAHQLYREHGRPAGLIELEVVDEETGKLEVTPKWQRWYRVDQYQRGENGEILYAEAGRPDHLFRNEGDGTFTDVTEEAGINTGPHWGNSATWWDFNSDGWPDIHVGNDFASPDFLYRNNGDGTFTEIAEETVRATTWFSMGAAQSDFNNDGYVDLLEGDMLPKTHYMKIASTATMRDRLDNMENVGGARQTMHNVLHINTGTDRFLEGAWMSGLAATEWTWAIRSADFDNDLRADAFFSNGVPRQFNHSDLPDLQHQDLIGRTHWDHLKHTPERREQNLAYRNIGEFQFEDVSQAWGLDHVGMSYGASLGDLDGDGRLDLLVSNLEDPLSVYWNRGDTGNRVLIDLCGTQSNLQGIGCVVTATTPDGVRQIRQHFPSGAFLNADESVVHFGLGENPSIATLKVEWPSGQSQIFRDLKANRRYKIIEPDAPAERLPAQSSSQPANPWFFESDVTAEIRHIEREFDDFQIQPLLPFKLSQLGPGQAWSDIDGDGDDDFFLAGATGQAGQIFINETSSASMDVLLKPLPCPALEADAEHEDMGALFLDVDSDGDQDLYVVSGSVEVETDVEILRDRIYLNDGKGSFTRAPKYALPHLFSSGSVVAPADYDRDGDLDLFVGTRSIPGSYPLGPASYLLNNRGGNYALVDHPFFKQAGMVTSAIWSDANGDGWPDLLMTTEWGPIHVLLNQEGTLEYATDHAGLDAGGNEMLGWWHGIAGGDLDGDGDIDYVATNLGNNTQYQASLESPELIFYGDFDRTGRGHIVEARFCEENGEKICYPRRGFMAAVDAMPFLADRMQTYHNYASLPLTGIYDISQLEGALQFRANQMENVALINDGNATFEARPLPRLSNIAPSFGVTLTDVDLDGHLDAYLVQNHYNPPEEVGPFASGLSILLKGTGKSDTPFEPIWSRESGLEVPGDAKSLAVVDINRDGRQDFMVGVNDSHPKLFINQTASLHDTHPLRIQFQGKAGNLRAVGAQARLEISGFPDQTREVAGGGSYLAQSGSDMVFAIPNSIDGDLTLQVRWPDGTSQSVDLQSSETHLSIPQP